MDAFEVIRQIRAGVDVAIIVNQVRDRNKHIQASLTQETHSSQFSRTSDQILASSQTSPVPGYVPVDIARPPTYNDSGAPTHPYNAASLANSPFQDLVEHLMFVFPSELRYTLLNMNPDPCLRMQPSALYISYDRPQMLHMFSDPSKE